MEEAGIKLAKGPSEALYESEPNERKDAIMRRMVDKAKFIKMARGSSEGRKELRGRSNAKLESIMSVSK